MKEPKFKVGEWCFCEFELKQIKSTEDDRITCVTDGFFSHSGHDLSDRCYPIEMKIKISSDEIKTWYRHIRNEAGNANINYPDINNKLIELWIDLCENRYDDERYNISWEKVQAFGNALQKKLRDMKYEEVDGIQILRR